MNDEQLLKGIHALDLLTNQLAAMAASAETALAALKDEEEFEGMETYDRIAIAKEELEDALKSLAAFAMMKIPEPG